MIDEGKRSFQSLSLDVKTLPIFTGSNIHFLNCEFTNNLELSETQIEKSMGFNRCVFKKVLIANTEIKYLLMFYYCKFLSSAHGQGLVIKESTIWGSISIHHCQINLIEILKSKFIEGSISIWDAKQNELSNPTIFISNSQFLTYVGINLGSNGYKKEQIKLTGTKFENDLHIHINSIDDLQVVDCSFKRNLLLTNIVKSKDRSDVNNLQMIGNTFEGFVRITFLNIQKLRLENITTKIPFLFKKNKIKKGDTETFKFLKHEHLRKDDNIAALEFRKKELRNSMKESIKSFSFFNIVNLGLNYISNDFGTNWFLAIIFTFSTAFFFFSFYIFLMSPQLELGWSVNGFAYIWSHYGAEFWTFFNPTHKPFSVTNLKPNFWSGAVDLVGRVFVVYGSYQTAQAFRKFGRK